MKKVVFFDFDGTLASTFDIVSKAFGVVEDKYMHRKFTNEDWGKVSGPNEEGIIERLVPDKKEAKQAFLDYIHDYRQIHNQYLKDFIPGIRELLVSLKSKGYRIFVLTGRSKETLFISLEKLDGFKYFADYFRGSTKGMVKDKVMLKAFEDLKICKDEAIYVGDTQEDIIQCRSIGVDIISVVYDNFATHDNIEKMNPGMVAHSPSEVENLIVHNWLFSKNPAKMQYFNKYKPIYLIK